MGSATSSTGTAKIIPSDLEKQKLLDKTKPGAQPGEGEGSDGLRPLLLASLGLCLSLASVLMFFWLFVDAFMRPWMWPLTGLLMISGHFSLWFSSYDSPPPRIAQHVSLVALIFETLSVLALSSAYWFPTFHVPFWWWQANVLVFLWPAMVLIMTAVYLVCTTAPVPPSSEQKLRWAHFIVPCGLYLIASVCFMSSAVLMFAGGTAVMDYIKNLVPAGVVAPGWGNEIITSESTQAFGFPICNMDHGNCSLKDMEMNQWTAVRTGGNTACLLGDYAFRVWRGESSKLLIIFDGGGACWNWATFVSGICSVAVGFCEHGVMNMKDPQNPYYGYTVVEIVYCSGDVFSGAAEQFWIMPAVSESTWKPQRGYENTLAVLEWTKAQFQGPHAALQSPLDRFMVMGESAGALGVQMWQHHILDSFKGLYRDENTFFLADSFLGLVVPNHEDMQRWVMDIWRVCDTPLPPAAWCKNRALVAKDIVLHNLQTFPDVRLLMILSKFDNIQIFFGDLILIFRNALDILYGFLTDTTDHPSVFTPAEFYEMLTGEVSQLAAYKQFAVFLVNSADHGYIFNKLQEQDDTTPRGRNTGCSEPSDGQRQLRWISPETPKPNQCWENATATPWSGGWCNASIHWGPGTCTK